MVLVEGVTGDFVSSLHRALQKFVALFLCSRVFCEPLGVLSLIRSFSYWLHFRRSACPPIQYDKIMTKR